MSSGTICGFDIVLSIKETAIQDQLQFLYDSPLGKKLLPKLGPAGSSQKVQPKQHYLIDHDFKAVLKKPDNKDFTLDGHILCPKIRLTPGGNRQASLGFTFCKDGTSSSTFTYWNGAEKKVITLDQWDISWTCDISSNRISNVMEKLINPSKKPVDESPVVLDPSLQASLEKTALSSKDLMVSSLFCVLESKSLASSLLVHDENGKDIAVEIYVALKEVLMQYVDELASKSSPGLPTTQNPFVLGYGVIQEPGKLAAAGHPTPPIFVPRDFMLSITPAKDNQPAVLNYLIGTNHSSSDFESTDPVDLEALNSYVRTWIAQADGFSGIMAFSRQLVIQQLVNRMLGHKFFDTMNVNAILNLDFLNYGVRSESERHESIASGPSSNKDWYIRNTFSSSFKTHEESWFFGIWTDKGEQSISGRAEVLAGISNDPAASKPDGTHRLFLTFDPSIVYDFYYSYIKVSENESRKGHVSLRYRIVLMVSTGTDGRWYFERGVCVLPEIKDGKLELRQEDANGRLGSFVWSVGMISVVTGGPEAMPFLFYDNVVKNLPDLQKLSDDSVQALMDALNDVTPTLNDMILMPAGDVYTFNGLGCVDEGYAIARVKYQSKTSGSHV